MTTRARVFWIGGIVVVLAGVLVASLRSGRGGEKIRVYAEKVERREITHTVKASGQIHPRVKVSISAHVVGKIEKLYVRDGDSIRAGAPFLQLERESFQAARDDARARQAMAETEQLQAEVARADHRVRLDRARRLQGDGIASKEDLESAQLQFASAELRVRSASEGVVQARAFLDKAEDELRKTTIWSPLTGRVIALNAEEGEVVVSGTMNNAASVIGIVADLSEVLAEVDVDETEVVHVQSGLPATVRVDALPDLEYSGKVVEVGSSGYTRPTQPDVQFFRVKILLERPDERLRPGMSSRADIRVSTQVGALSVPIQSVVERSALDQDEEGAGGSADEIPVAFVVDAGNARQRAVQTGISDATHVEIVSGLAEGDQVITGPYRSLKKLRDADRVRIAKPATEDDEAEDDRDSGEDD